MSDASSDRRVRGNVETLVLAAGVDPAHGGRSGVRNAPGGPHRSGIFRSVSEVSFGPAVVLAAVIAEADSDRLFDRSDIRDRRVTVEYQTAGGRTLEFEGVITYVSTTVDGVTNRFQVEATVQNRMENDLWLLPHEAFARMTIHTEP